MLAFARTSLGARVNTTTEGSWASRNWKWAAPTGCLLAVIVVGGFIAAIMFFVMTMMKSNDVYQHAVDTARRNPEVIARLGEPIEESWFVTGNWEESGGAGQAQLSIPLHGPKGKGTIYVEARKSAGQWNYAVLAVEFEGGGANVDLRATPAAPPLPPPSPAQ